MPPEFEDLKRQGFIIGTCGKGFTWTLGKDGTMRIYGDGEMPDDADFFSDRTFNKWEVHRMVFCDSITKIGRKAFSDFGIVQIDFPKSLKQIGDGAFWYCYIREITIPEGTEVIGASAFSNCSYLRKVVLPQSLKYIGSGAFWICRELRDITIPPGAIVESSIFDRTPFAEESPTEVLYKDGWALCYAREPSTEILQLQPGAKKIASLAFGVDCHAECKPYTITELILNDDLCYIGSQAFARTKIEKVTANCTFEYIGSNIFEDTPWLCSRPNEVMYLANAALINKDNDSERLKILSEHEGRKIDLIAPYCFFENEKLREVEIGENIEVIPSHTFYRCAELEKIIIPSSVKELSKCAIFDCPKLKSVYIPKTVTEIGEHAVGYTYNSEWWEKHEPFHLTVPDFTIITESGSEAEKYALENKFKLQII